MLSNLLTRAATSKYRPVRELYDRFSHTTTFQNIINQQSNMNDKGISSNPFLDKPLKTSNILGKIEDMEMKDVTQNIQNITPDVLVTQTDVIATPVDNHVSPENDSTTQKSVDDQPKPDENIKPSTALTTTNTYSTPRQDTDTLDMNFITAWFWVIIIVMLIVAAVGFVALILYMILYIICYPLLWMLGLT